MTDDGKPWAVLPRRPDTYSAQDRTDLVLIGKLPVVEWDSPDADHPVNCRCPGHLGGTDV
jgi:hypothetical protein